MQMDLSYYGLGKSLVEMGEYKAAIAPLEQALALQPSLIQAHFQLARAYRQLGQTEEARHEAQLFSAMTDRIDTSRELKGSEEENAWKQVKPLLEANKEQEALKLLGKLRISEGSIAKKYIICSESCITTWGGKRMPGACSTLRGERLQSLLESRLTLASWSFPLEMLSQRKNRSRQLLLWILAKFLR